MTVDETLIYATKLFERDLWLHVVDSPPDGMLIADACSVAAQLAISMEGTKRFGTPIPQSEEFVRQADSLAVMIDRLGGEARLKTSLLWMQFLAISDFAHALLDMMCSSCQ